MNHAVEEERKKTLDLLLIRNNKENDKSVKLTNFFKLRGCLDSYLMYDLSCLMEAVTNNMGLLPMLIIFQFSM